MPITPDDAAMLTGFFDAVEVIKNEVERKWGFGRVEILCAANPALLARFRGQQARWRSTLEAAWKADFLTRDVLQLVEQKAGAMQRAWAALDAYAAEAGHREIYPYVWEAKLEDGSIAAIVETDAEASYVIAEGRYLSVYTLHEIAQLIDMIPGALQLAKQVFPGAKFQLPASHWRSPDKLPFDDPIPFGDATESDVAPWEAAEEV